MEIYLITNDINGKLYIGQTRLTLEERREWYLVNVKYHKNGRYPIVFAMRKHGFDNFDFETLRKCSSREELDFWESYYIKKLQTQTPNGYNVHAGGRSPYTIQQLQELARRSLREKLILKRYHTLKREVSSEEVDDLVKAMGAL